VQTYARIFLCINPNYTFVSIIMLVDDICWFPIGNRTSHC